MPPLPSFFWIQKSNRVDPLLITSGVKKKNVPSLRRWSWQRVVRCSRFSLNRVWYLSAHICPPSCKIKNGLKKDTTEVFNISRFQKTDSIWMKKQSISPYNSPTMNKKFPNPLNLAKVWFSKLASWLDFTLDFTQQQRHGETTWKKTTRTKDHQSMTGRPSNNTLARHWASLIRKFDDSIDDGLPQRQRPFRKHV